MKSHLIKVMLPLLLLSGCASNSSQSSTSSTTEGEAQNVELSIWHTFTEHQQDLIESLADEYEAEHPNVTINVIGGYDPNTFNATVQDAVVNGVGPSLVFVDDSFAYNFEAYDMLIDFSDYWDYDYASMVAPLTYEGATNFTDGALYAPPIQITGPVLYYNKALYDQFDLPTPTTWDDVKTASRTIYENTGIVGLGIDSLADLAQIFVLQTHDGQYYNDSDNTVAWNDASMQQWVDWWAEGVHEGYFQVAPTTGDYNSSDINAGVIATYIGSSAGLPFLDLSGIDGELAVVRTPYIDEDSKEVVAWQRSAIGFSKDEAHDAAAADFVTYFISQDDRWAQVLNAYSPYYAIQQDSEYQSFIADNLSLSALSQQVDNGVTIPWFVGSDTVRTELQGVFSGAADPNFDSATALQTAADRSEAAMRG